MIDQIPKPVSTQVIRVVPAAKTAEFEDLLKELNTAARGFEGHLGVDVLRPEGGGTYQIVFRFRDQETHDRWIGAEQRLRLVARVDELLDDSTEARMHTAHGWEAWFVAPANGSPPPPKRWKMALLTFCALYPIVFVLTTVLGPLTQDWPRATSLLLVIGLTVSLMTWVVMPRLTAALGPWLRRNRSQSGGQSAS